MEVKSQLRSEIKKSFHDFAVLFFKNPEIEEACLTLYEKYKVNANMLMLCCWLAKENYERITKEHVAFILSRTKRWNSCVLQPLIHLSYRLFPFRQTIRFSKPYRWVEDGVNRAASVERSLMLDVLRDLEKQTGKEISNMNFALGNIFRYLEYLQVSLHQNDLEKIYRITTRAI